MAPSENPVQAMRRWLAQGLGRAVLHLELHDSAPFRDLILNACLYEAMFDPQTAPDRAPYLYDVLAASGEEDYFRRRILAALAAPADDLNVDELCGLLLEWARRGDAECRRALYALAGDLAAAGLSYPAYRLIDLDGWDGFVFAAERLGAAIIGGADEVHAGALNHITERLGEGEVAARLDELRARNPLIAAYLDELEADQARMDADRSERDSHLHLDYWQFTARLTPAERRWGLAVCRWARRNPDAPWPDIAADVLAETDPDVQAGCLRMFGQIEFPLGHAPLLPLLWSDHERLVGAAVSALEWFEHPAIRAEGLAMLSADHCPDSALRLLAADWQPGDYLAIKGRLLDHASADELHDLGRAVLNIVDEHQEAEAAAVLLYLYEHGPCARCRGRVVEHLLELEALPDWMRYECGFDSNPGTRALVRPQV